MPSLDICFCGNTVGCPYRYTCRRNPANHKIDDEYITLSEFEHTDTNCDYYWEM